MSSPFAVSITEGYRCLTMNGVSSLRNETFTLRPVKRTLMVDMVVIGRGNFCVNYNQPIEKFGLRNK
jgi:hypothetical protein